MGGRAPSAYLAKLEQQGITRQRLNTILESHLIEPATLWHDDFDGFFATRWSRSEPPRASRALLQLIGQAMGRKLE